MAHRVAKGKARRKFLELSQDWCGGDANRSAAVLDRDNPDANVLSDLVKQSLNSDDAQGETR
jgi:hypothetical protein